MVSGLEIRMNRIMNQGRMLCIPMDHGISNGPIPGLEDPHGAIAKCANHGLTSVIINKGILKSIIQGLILVLFYMRRLSINHYNYF